MNEAVMSEDDRLWLTWWRSVLLDAYVLPYSCPGYKSRLNWDNPIN